MGAETHRLHIVLWKRLYLVSFDPYVDISKYYMYRCFFFLVVRLVGIIFFTFCMNYFRNQKKI